MADKNDSNRAEQARGMYVHPAVMVILVAGLAVLLTVMVMNHPGELSVKNGDGAAVTQTASAGLQLYYSTMHPWIVQDHPGTCPICGMELVKMPKDEQAKYLENHPEFS